MSLITQCPKCGTRFRVSPEQLEARGGKVRCGLCLNIFDGREPLITTPDAPPVTGQDTGAFRLEPVEPGAAAPEFPAAPEHALEERDYGPAPEQLSFDDQVWIEEEHARRRRAAIGWGLGAMALFLVLGVHAAYVFRSELGARFPGLKPQLAGMCALLKCTVMPPQRPQLIAIEASDLQFKDAAQPSLIQLTATLRNHAGYDVGYPALDLVLTNQLEHTLARRIFLPADYLRSGRDATAGISANAEITVRLDLDTGTLNPAGYRLNLLAAP